MLLSVEMGSHLCVLSLCCNKPRCTLNITIARQATADGPVFAKGCALCSQGGRYHFDFRPHDDAQDAETPRPQWSHRRIYFACARRLIEMDTLKDAVKQIVYLSNELQCLRNSPIDS